MTARVLIVDDERDMRWVLTGLFRDGGYETVEAADGEQALQRAADQPFDVVVSDVRMPNVNGVELLRELVQRDPDLPVILLSAVEDLETAVGAMKQGAYDWVGKPFEPQRLLATVDRAVDRRRLSREVADLRDRLEDERISFGVSNAARELDRTLDLFARQGTLSVLIQGESGTGKEVIAREIHRRSPLAGGRFVAVDCGALPEPLMESQLFGHRKGAFTGADRERPGLFRMADGGTLFLDELGNLPLALQSKLLRALQERTVVPVGGGEPVPFAARLLCATNASLQTDVQHGRFRIDLFHRIAEVTLEVPPLRERPDDIAHFAREFLGEANAEMGRRVFGFDADADAALRHHDWPGNLRELRNAVRRAVVLAAGDTLAVKDLDLEVPPPPLAVAPAALEPAADDLSLTERIRQATHTLEAQILRDTLEAAGGNKAAAARALQIDYTTLHRKLKRHGLLTVARRP